MFGRKKIKQYAAQIEDVNRFFAHFHQETNAAPQNWKFATLDLEKSLDSFMLQLAASDKLLAIQVATAFAKYAFKYIAQHHIDQVKKVCTPDSIIGFFETDPCDVPIEKQIKDVENWLKNPTEEQKRLVKEGIDPRQLNIWDKELFPSDDEMWIWLLEVSNLLSYAVVADSSSRRRGPRPPRQTDSEAEDMDMEGSDYEWSYKACVARSAVCALKTIAEKERTIEADLIALLKKLGEEL